MPVNNIVKFQKINKYAEHHGFLSGFPTFDDKDDYVIGLILLSDRLAEKRFVNESDYEGFAHKNIPSMFRAANDYAKRNGFAAAFPNFQTADDRQGLLFGTILIKQDKTITKEVTKKELGIDSIEDVPAMMKAAHNYAIKNGFVTGFPTFHENGIQLTISIVLFRFDIPIKRDMRPDWIKPGLTDGIIYHGDRYITIDQFADNLKTALDGHVLKYAFVIRHKLAMASGAAGKKNTGPDDFTIYTRYNPASVTKTFTAVALLRVLENNSLSIDDLISPYLPTTWNKNNITGITFRQVLTHSAGFPMPSLPDNVDYNTVRDVIVAGPNTVAAGADDALLNTPRYKNVNYAICRILVDYLDGYNEANYADQSAGTSSHFINYLQRNIFDPINITNVEFTPPSSNATIFYEDPQLPSDMGDDYGDWSLKPGSAGVQLSTKEISDFVFRLNLDNSLLSDNMKSQMNSLLLGWDHSNVFENDKFLYKGGGFPHPPLHSGIYLFENGLQVTFVFNGDPHIDVVSTAYTQSWMNSKP